MADDSERRVTFRIQRYDPEQDTGPYMQEYTVPTSRGMTVLMGLLYIKEHLDGSLAFRTSCRMGICGSCAMMVNDYPHLACHTQIEEFHSDTLTIKALPNFPTIKDLVPDLDSLFQKHKDIKPYVIRDDEGEMNAPTAEYIQRPKELNEFLGFTYCIKCGICISSCPTSATDRAFIGPQALAQCYRYCADSRDDGQDERLRVADTEHGIWHCHFAGACSEACPKGVDPGFAIQLLKRRMVSSAIGLKKKQKPAAVVPPPTETKPKVPYPEFTVKSE